MGDKIAKVLLVLTYSLPLAGAIMSAYTIIALLNFDDNFSSVSTLEQTGKGIKNGIKAVKDNLIVLQLALKKERDGDGREGHGREGE